MKHPSTVDSEILFSDFSVDVLQTFSVSNLTLDDVIAAIRRSERIMRNKAIEEKPIQYKKFFYYTENPALTIWESIRDILSDCRLLDL